MIDKLIVQTYCWKPCFETAAEIALQSKKAGENVWFLFIDTDDPFEPPPFGIWPVQPTKRRKYHQAAKILKEHGIGCAMVDLTKSPHRNEIDIDVSKIETHSDLRELTVFGARLGQGVLSHLITSTANPYVSLQSHRAIVGRSVASVVMVYQEAIDQIKRRQPREIIVYNGRFASVNAIAEAAKACSVRVKYFEEAATYDKYFVHDQWPFDLDYNIALMREAWNSAPSDKEELAKSFFVKARHGKKERHNFVAAQEKGRVPERQCRRRVTYFSSSDDEYMALPINNAVGRSPMFSSQREAVEYLVKWVANSNDTELVIRVHPHISKKCKEERAFWNSIRGKNVTLLRSDSSFDSYRLIECSDIVICFHSTVGIEATFWGVPAIAIANTAYRETDSVYEPQSIGELVTLLEADLPPKEKTNCYIYGYWASVKGNSSYHFYQPETWSEGRFCGKRLSMDLFFVDAFKRSRLGKQVKLLRDRLVAG